MQLQKGWGYPGDGCGGEWNPRGGDISKYLARQAAWQVVNSRLQHNEFIIGGKEWDQKLPDLIDAFFVAKGSAAAQTASYHERFLAAYPHMSASDVPLVTMDLANWATPFSSLNGRAR